MSPTKGVGSFERFLMDVVGGGVVWLTAHRFGSHTPYMSMESQKRPRSNRVSKSWSCPMSSPFHDDGREVYHPFFRLGNYPFIGGTRPAPTGHARSPSSTTSRPSSPS